MMKYYCEVLKKLIFNNRLIPESSKIPYTERAFMYGDGAFESLFTLAGQAPLLDYHHRRLIQAAGHLSLRLPENLADLGLLKKLIADHSFSHHQRIRLSIWRAQGGRYAPQDNDAHYLMEITHCSSCDFIQSKSCQHVGTAREVYIFTDSIGKLMSASQYVRASIEAQARGLDDLILIDSHHQFCESTHSGLLLYSGGEFFAPSDGHAGVPSTSLQWLIDLLNDHGKEVNRVSITQSIMDRSESIFLINATSGLRWIEQFDGRLLSSSPYEEILTLIQETIPWK